ncbi:hypothetical protein DMENIID0001_169150 [Sergentomyia squamirostris]
MWKFMDQHGRNIVWAMMLKVGIPLPASNFTAELMGIKIALQHVSSVVTQGDRFFIFTDSLSALQALRSVCDSGYDSTLSEIRATVAGLFNNNKFVTFMWIPAHVGIEGNERADVLAKRAAALEPNMGVRGRTDDWFAELESRMRIEWQLYWEMDDRGRWCHSILPDIGRRPWFYRFHKLNRRIIVTVSRIISNHFALRAHLFRINLAESPYCEVCQCHEDVDHVIFRCPRYMAGRLELLHACSMLGFGAGVREIIAISLEQGLDNPLKAIADFIKNNNINV